MWDFYFGLHCLQGQTDAYAEPELWDWENTALTAPCPTQTLRLPLYKEKAGWEDGTGGGGE